MVLAYPFLEQWITGDKREHHLLQRPRNAPTRTAFLAAMVTLYGLLWAAGGNDILATHVPPEPELHHLLHAGGGLRRPGDRRSSVAKRWCISLQRHDNDKLLHGYETGIIMRSPEGGYTERHLPISEDRAYTLTARDRDEVYAGANGTDANGVERPDARVDQVRAALSKAWFADQRAEADRRRSSRRATTTPRRSSSTSTQLGLDHQADGHQFDGRHDVAGDDLTHKH